MAFYDYITITPIISVMLPLALQIFYKNKIGSQNLYHLTGDVFYRFYLTNTVYQNGEPVIFKIPYQSHFHAYHLPFWHAYKNPHLEVFTKLVKVKNW